MSRPVNVPCFEEEPAVTEARDAKSARGVVAAVVIATLIAGACAFLCGGCVSGAASRGRVSLVEWDSRDKDQLQAAAELTRAYYGDTQAPAPQESRSFTAWAALFDMISKLKIKLSLVLVEWQTLPEARQ